MASNGKTATNDKTTILRSGKNIVSSEVALKSGSKDSAVNEICERFSATVVDQINKIVEDLKRDLVAEFAKRDFKISKLESDLKSEKIKNKCGKP